MIINYESEKNWKEGLGVFEVFSVRLSSGTDENYGKLSSALVQALPLKQLTAYS
jgi:hypothetical protein